MVLVPTLKLPLQRPMFLHAGILASLSALRTQIWVTAGHLVVTGPQKPITENLGPGVGGGMGCTNP